MTHAICPCCGNPTIIDGHGDCSCVRCEWEFTTIPRNGSDLPGPEEIQTMLRNTARLIEEKPAYEGADPALLREAADQLAILCKIQSGQESKGRILNVYRRALISIAGNTCCAGCREAALVAQATLSNPHGDEPNEVNDAWAIGQHIDGVTR